MNVLGIHDGHNASAVLLRDGRIIAGVQEERPRGVKNALGLPREAIRDVLSQGGLTPAEIDWVALSGLHSGEYLDLDASIQPSAQILRWHQALYDQPPLNVKRFVRRLIPDPIYESLRGDRVRRRRLDVVAALGFRRDRIRLVEHHTAHAASAYYGWGKLDEPILILTNDVKGVSGDKEMRKSRAHVLLFSLIALLLGTSLSLLLAESAVRLFAPQALVSDIIAADPDVDYRLRANARGRMIAPEYAAEIRVNALGFRGEEIALAKPPGVYRVLFLGDSFVFGHGLGEHETLPYFVGRELDRRHPGKFEVVNGGVYGYCTANEVEFFLKYGRPLQPNLVVILVMVHNMIDNAAWYELTDDGRLARKPRTSQYTKSRRLTRYLPGAAWLRAHSHLFKFVGIRVLPVLRAGGGTTQATKQAMKTEELSSDFYQEERGPFRVTTALLAKLIDGTREHGAQSILLTLEGGEEIMGGETSSRRMLVQERLGAAALAMGFSEVIALSPILAGFQGQERLFFPQDRHWTAAATRFVAPAVAEVIARGSARPSVQSPQEATASHR